MKISTKSIVPPWQYAVVLALAAFVGIWSLLTNSEHLDIIATLISRHLSVLISQSLLLVLIMWQVLTYKSMTILIGVRHKSSWMQRKLFWLVLTEVSLYFAVYYSLFIFSGVNFFSDGTASMGSIILVLRYLVMLGLGVLLVGSYRFQRPGVLMLAALLLNFFDHYWLEGQYLLIMYSPIYDPLYRAIHHIYRG